LSVTYGVNGTSKLVRESHPPHFSTNPPLSSGALGEILSLASWMMKQGYKDSTIRAWVRSLKGLARRADLLNPESVKAYLAGAKLSEARSNPHHFSANPKNAPLLPTS